MLTANHLRFSYTAGKTFSFPELYADAAAPLLITGKSGCGKSTLLHLLGCLLNPAEGSIRIADTDVTKLKGRKADAFRGQHIGIIFQRHHLIASLDVHDNLLMPLYCSMQTLTSSKAKKLSAELQIEHLLYKHITQLSTGEQQRVCIARALIHAPKLLLADEPTSSLDDENATAVLTLLKEHSAALGTTLVIVTHDERIKQKIQNRVQLK